MSKDKKITCGVFLVNKNNEILVCHPTNHKENIWSIPKGIKEKDEDEFDAALRELHEETNILINRENLKVYKTLNKFSYKHGKKTLQPFFIPEVENELDFGKFELKCNENVKLFGGHKFPEVDDYWWVDIHKAKDYLHETQVMAISQLNAFL